MDDESAKKARRGLEFFVDALEAGGDWLSRVDRVAYRWREFFGDGWHFSDFSPKEEKNHIDPLFTDRQMRMAFRLGVAWGWRGTPENIAAADREFDSWHDVMLRARDSTCPNGMPHSHSFDNPPPGYCAVCIYCNHKTEIPF